MKIFWRSASQPSFWMLYPPIKGILIVKLSRIIGKPYQQHPLALMHPNNAKSLPELGLN